MITMAKTFDMEHFEDAVISEVYVLVNGVKYPLIVEYEKESTTPATASKLNQIIDEIDTLCREGTTSKDIVIGDETEVTDDTKILIDTGEVENLGSEVVDSLEGNETNKSPSVKAVNNAIGIVGWTNPNPNSEFPGQTINLSTEDYNYYEIEFSLINSGNATLSTGKISKNQKTYLNYVGGNGALLGFNRNIANKTNASITFEDAIRINTSAVENTRCIPQKVILYKIGE